MNCFRQMWTLNYRLKYNTYLLRVYLQPNYYEVLLLADVTTKYWLLRRPNFDPGSDHVRFVVGKLN